MISSISCLRTRLQSQCWHAWALSHSMEIASIQLNHIESNSYNSLLTFAYNILIILGFFSRHLLSMHSQESESSARIDSNFRMRMAQVDSNKNLWCTAVWLNGHRLDRFSKGATTLLWKLNLMPRSYPWAAKELHCHLEDWEHRGRYDRGPSEPGVPHTDHDIL